jgi:hypothetical protein
MIMPYVVQWKNEYFKGTSACNSKYSLPCTGRECLWNGHHCPAIEEGGGCPEHNAVNDDSVDVGG